VAVASLGVLNRDSTRTFTGNCAIRSVNVAWCCWASSVVGTRIATCFPSCTALNAARTAISVLPYPTSPQITQSIGTDRSITAITWLIASSWSGVSTYGKASSNSRCHGVSGPNANPWALVRAAYSRISSPAISLTALRARPLVFAQSAPPSRFSAGFSPPTYRVTWSKESVGTYSRSAGGPLRAGASSRIRYSRSPPFTVRRTISTYRPTPCCSCTTRSPAWSCSGSIWCRRRDGIRRMSLVDAPRVPVRSASVTTASRSASERKPWSSCPVLTAATPLAVQGGQQRGGDVRAAEPLGGPLGRPVPVEQHGHPPAVVQPAGQVGDRPLGVPAVRLGGAGGHHQRVPVAGLGGRRGRPATRGRLPARVAATRGRPATRVRLATRGAAGRLQGGERGDRPPRQRPA